MKRLNMNPMSRALNRQAGASLLEAIAFLGVAATIIVGAVALLSTAFSSARSNRSHEEVMAISTGVKRLYMSQAGSYGTVDMTAALANAKIFPSTLAVIGGAVTNAWNGAVVVTGATSTFTISYADVPQEVCVELVADSVQWIGVSVNGTALTLPSTVAAASAACNAAANTVVWTGR
jgi:hypothetical protein